MKTGQVIELPMPRQAPPAQPLPPRPEKLIMVGEGEAPPPGAVKASDVLNNFSNRIATQAAALLNAGMPLSEMITMHIDHAAGLLALMEPLPARGLAVARARQQLSDFTAKKRAQRHKVDAKTGSKGYRGA